MDVHPSELAGPARPMLTCSRCGDNLAVAVSGSGRCPACIRRLGERALDRLVPVRRALGGLLVACAVVSAVGLLSSVLQLMLLERMQVGDFTQAEAESNDLREAVVGVVQTALYLTTCVAWCVWFRRSHHFVEVADRPMEFGPNAWGWFFVPFANLWKPYQAVKELWLGATRHEHGERPAIFVAWWSTWLLSNATGNALLQGTLKQSSEISALIGLTYLQIFDAAVAAAAALTALLAASAVDQALRVEALAERT